MKKIFLPHLYIFISLLFIFPTLSHSQTSEIPLKKGWNIISLVNPTQSKAVEEVLESIDGKYRDVWEYDSENSLDPWKHYHPQFSSFSDLKEIGLNKKYWIYALQDTILVIEELDTTPPDGTIKINLGDEYTATKSRTVELTLSSSDVTQMQFSNDTQTWSGPEPYAGRKNWELSGGDGEKTVYVKFADNAFNWSEPICAKIILDTICPGSMTLNSAQTPTNQIQQTFSGSKDANTSLWMWDSWAHAGNIKVIPVNEETTWSYTVTFPKDGDHTVFFVTRDPAANRSNSVSAAVTVDTTHPSGTIYINASDGQTVDSPKVTLKISADSSAVLMRFSEDNVTWTESEPFKETKEWEFSDRDGLKTIYVKFADSVGNWSTAAYDTIILNRGLIIGSEGGEVFSSDKKIKVTIPPGALYVPEKISILNLDKIEFLSLAPENTAIMSIVECLPYGLTFQKPVSLTYFFDEAEVPGTLMQLGLYNALQKKIELSEKSAVGVNGDKVTFTLSHFSTYAALKNLVSGGAPIGGGVQIPLPDMFTGAFSHSIPISVAPARAGMQPQISLKYHSSNANSWLGVGFDLNPGYIVRSTKNGFPAYDDVQDIFLMVTDAGTTELVHLTDNVYQAKAESDFTKFFKETNDNWRAVRKNGTVLRFGENDPSKENFYFGAYKWNLTEIADPNGNYISYSYVKENTKSYLYSISYGGNKKGYSHKNKLVFTLESREDIFSNYLSGGGIITQKRLKNIQITVLENILWTYKLEYVYSAETGRSLLTYVRQTAGNGEELPARKFNY